MMRVMDGGDLNPAEPPPEHAVTLNENACKARYGVAHFRALCSQAGLGFAETSPDEDTLAVDGEVQFDEASVRVQIKCTAQFKIRGNSASWPSEVHWRDAWSRSAVPVYFVLVLLDVSDRCLWLAHSSAGTMHHAAAFWVRVGREKDAARTIVVDKSQRLTTATFSTWARDLHLCFTSAEGRAS
jgi:hypothetical protein